MVYRYDIPCADTILKCCYSNIQCSRLFKYSSVDTARVPHSQKCQAVDLHHVHLLSRKLEKIRTWVEV